MKPDSRGLQSADRTVKPLLTRTVWSRRQALGLTVSAAAAFALGACGGSSTGSEAGAPDGADGWAGTLLDPPFAKPDAQFTDFDGKPFPFIESTKGRLTVLFFGYTNCPDVCPTYLNTMAAARRLMGTGPGSDALTLFVGVDVARDTPAVLKTYLGNIDDTFVGLTGTEEEIAAATTHLKLPSAEIGSPDAEGRGLPREQGTSELACPRGRPGKMHPCPSPIRRSSATMS